MSPAFPPCTAPQPPPKFKWGIGHGSGQALGRLWARTCLQAQFLYL